MMHTNEPQQIAESELDPGERLLWFGKPISGGRTGYVVTGSILAILIVVSITIVGLSLVTGKQFSLVWLLVAFTLPWLIPLCMSWADTERRRKTVYAVTDRRIMVIVSGRTKTVQSYGPDEIGNLQRVEQSDGWGNLTFARQFAGYGGGSETTQGYAQFNDIQFVGIPDVRSVESLIRDTFLRAPSP